MSIPVPDAAEALRASGFRLLRQCGEGGSADVFEAEQLASGRRVALKRLRPHASSAAHARFRAEAALLAELSSDHVVRLHEDHSLRGFFTMELLEGKSLEEVACAPLPPARVLQIVCQVAHALQVAHDHGVVHCDLKPENVFLCAGAAGAPRVTLLDFGIARRRGARRTRELFGTPLFMSPEQAREGLGEIDVTADVWALGQLAFRLLAGRPYYPAEPIQRTILRVAYDPMEAPSAIGCVVSSAFDAWFLRSCEREPQRRYSNVREQVESLSEALAKAEVRLALQEVRPSLICDGATAPTYDGAWTPTPPTCRRGYRMAWVAGLGSIALSCLAMFG